MSESLLLAERVADDIERLIAEGYYSPGEKLPSEAILTEKYKIGRSTLREATKILKTKNVLESHRGIGTFVRTPSSNETVFSLADVENTEKNKLNVFDIRLLIEPEAAAMAAMNATEAQIAELDRQCTVIERLMDANQDYGKADSIFHQMIAMSSGNEILSDLVAVFVNSDFMSISDTDDECRQAARQSHRAIIESIRTRDIQGARYNMVNHIGHSRSFFIRCRSSQLG